MKRLITILLVLFAVISQAQISDALLQDTIDLWIVPNNAKSITAARLNSILTWSNLNKIHKDSTGWTLTGDDISNNNAGKVLIDTLTGEYPGIEINQKDSVLQFEENTGTDYTVGTAYVALKFTADVYTNYRAVGLRLKKDGTITNVAAYLQYKIYTDAAGAPGTSLSTGYQNVCFGYISTSYSEHVLQVGGPLLTSGTAYWVVIYRSAAPSGGNVYIDCSNAGTALLATSANGTSWTGVNSYTGWMKFYYGNHAGLEVNACNYFAIEANSVNSYGVEANSIYDPALRGESVNSQGVTGLSTYAQGLYGYSVNGYGLQATSTNEIGISAASTTKHGINGETSVNSYSYAGVRGFAADAIGVLGNSTGKYGVQAQSTNNYASYMVTSNSTGVLWLLNNYSGTTDLQRIALLTRSTSGTAAAGLGGSLDWMIENAAGTETVLHARIGAFAQRVVAGEERGAIGFYTKGTASPPSLKAMIDSTGNYISDKRIGIGDWKSPAYTLEVSGNGFFADDLTLDDNLAFVGAGQISTTGNGTLTLDAGDGLVDIPGDMEADTVQCTYLEAGAIKDINTMVTSGYTIPIFAGSLTPADSKTYYYGNVLGLTPTETAGDRKMYIPQSGTIKSCYISTNATTAGSDEDWPIYIRLNNTTDYGIDTVSAATNLRQWINTGLNIAITAGDYIEIKTVTPAFATNPVTWVQGGYIYIEQ